MAEITLTKGHVALIDDEDVDRISPYNWRYSFGERDSTPYATTTMNVSGKRRTVFLHRFILSAPDGLLVDHRNRNGLDCRRANIRLATRSQNSVYSIRKPGCSGFRGVRLNKRCPGWAAEIDVDCRTLRLGTFDRPEDAARAYDAAAEKYHGEFAVFNFPDDRGVHVAPRKIPARLGHRNVPVGASGFRGVTTDRNRSGNPVFRPVLWVNGECLRLGRFKSAEEAARVYDEAARRLRPSEPVLLNFPEITT